MQRGKSTCLPRMGVAGTLRNMGRSIARALAPTVDPLRVRKGATHKYKQTIQQIVVNSENNSTDAKF